MKIYVASSWRNPRQPAVVEALRAAGHDVYDFRNPAPGNTGFGWRQCDPRPPSEWSVEDYRRVLTTPRAQEGFALDMGALRAADACVLVLPCGRSAHLELGWAVGAGKRTLVLCEQLDEPELMYLMCDGGAASICASVEEIVARLSADVWRRPPEQREMYQRGVFYGLQAAEQVLGQHPEAQSAVREFLRVQRTMVAALDAGVVRCYAVHHGQAFCGRRDPGALTTETAQVTCTACLEAGPLPTTGAERAEWEVTAC